MADKGSEDTFVHTLAGREMVFEKTQPGQLIMMRRYVAELQVRLAAAERDSNDDERVKVLTQIHEVAWTAVESRFTSVDDLDFARMSIITGKLTAPELFVILSNGETTAVPAEDDADPVRMKQRTVAGNAKKAAKKAAPTPRAKR